MSELFLVFGDHLFPEIYFNKFKKIKFLMIESPGICRHFKYHKMRLAFILSATRHKYLEFKKLGYDIDYIYIDELPHLESPIERLREYCLINKIQILHIFEKEDKFYAEEIKKISKELPIELKIYQSPAFLNTKEDFKLYLQKNKKPFMKKFYEDSRKRFKVLVDSHQNPIGGKWSFDEDNRNKLKSNVFVPNIQFPVIDETTINVIKLVNVMFPDHPGTLEEDGSNFYLPVSRVTALEWFEVFLTERFYNFGAYEDALSLDHEILFHSLLSPLLNLGLLIPKEIIQRSLEFAKVNKTPLNSLEGFIRQILGWREFVRGIYGEFSEVQDKKNFFNHTRKLSNDWYSGTTGITPLDFAIKKVMKNGYLHHIERLMIVSNLMLLCEIDPNEVHRWFNELFVDSMDWVMGPNVYGMGQFSDGGIFATKPYICGSNYILKMSNFTKGEWSVEMDALYWSFIFKNREFFLKNPRMAMMVRTFEKMDTKKQEEILVLSEHVRERLTF